MPPLPSANLRTNVGTWAAPTTILPSVAAAMIAALPEEKYDPDFLGQDLQTYYFDTRGFDLRKARKKGRRYITVRLRRYTQANAFVTYAASAKTEDQKWRTEIDDQTATALLAWGAGALWTSLLPSDLLARFLSLTDRRPVEPVVCIHCRRYAVEDAAHRLTLDVAIHTDTDRRFACAVLEQKSIDNEATPLLPVPLRPIKLSKFLWSTCP